MKIVLVLLLSAVFLARAEQDEIGVVDYGKGFVLGLHLEKLAPSLKHCANAMSNAVQAARDVINAFNEHQTFYNLMNNATKGLGTLSPLARQCVLVPNEVMKNLREKYFEKFEYSWEKYLHAVFLNLGYRMDEIVKNVLKIREYFDKGDYYNAGFYSGDTVNIVFNVTTQAPVPRPSPFSANEESTEYPTIEEEEHSLLEVRTNWTDLHEKFREYYNYSMIILNYTKWINGTTSKNLNSSVMNIEMNLYTSLMELQKPEPNIQEAILTLIDITLHVNALFNGIYFSIVQIPEKIFKDSVFQHIDYLPLNLLLHSGYFVYDGYRLYDDIVDKKYFDMCRRITIIIRKFLYFDEDVLDEINNGVSVEDM